MKVLAVLLCVFVTVQGRSTDVQSTRVEAALGENPWLVHLRIAISTSGLLETGVGSLISNSWVLTSGPSVADARFIWVRYGVVNVINPSLVTEANNAAVRLHSAGEIALISINRFVQPTANISPVALSTVSGDAVESASLCGFGTSSDDDNAPGEVLSCSDVILQTEDGVIVASSDIGGASKFDLGAPLVSYGEQVGVLVAAADDSTAGKYLPVADYLDWIAGESGIDFSSAAAKAVDSEDLRVKFVN